MLFRSHGSSHCDHEACRIERPHCHICKKDSCGVQPPHCHVCEHENNQNEQDPARPDLAAVRNETQPGSIEYETQLLDTTKITSRSEGTQTASDKPSPEVVYHSAEWQPSYAVGGGTDLTRMLRPTPHRTFSWGGPGTSNTIPSTPDSGSSSAPETGVDEGVRVVR